MSRGATILAPNGRPARLEVRNLYDAASTTSPYRSTISSKLQDANKDIPKSTRQTLAKQSWHWYQNSPLVTGIIERLVTYTVGTGLIPVASTADKGWNRACNSYWSEASESVEFRHGLAWGDYVAMVWRGVLVGGDCLTTYPAGEAKLIVWESHDITTTGGGSAATYTDGLTLDALGRVVGYEITGGVKVSAANATLHWLSLRPKQYRGIPILASALLSIHDISDILALEKQAVKTASGKTDIVKTASGEMDDEAIIRGTYTGADDETKATYYKESFGAEAVVLKPGDEFTPYAPARPSPAWQGFMTWLSQVICLATGIPPSVIVPVDGNGVDVRRDLATAQRVVERWQSTLAAQLRQPRNRIVQAGIDSGELSPAPEKWTRARWQCPRAITVDSGRDMKADMALVQAGLMTREEFHSQFGQNAEEEEAKMIEENAGRKAALEAAGLTIEELAELLSMKMQNTPHPAPQQGTP